MKDPARQEQPVYYVATLQRPDFSLDEAAPQFADTIDEQIKSNDASDDFIKEEAHANVRSSLYPRYPGLIWPDWVLV
jgi:hypothetical protein